LNRSCQGFGCTLQVVFIRERKCDGIDQKLLRLCLQKDPNKHRRDAGDLTIDIDRYRPSLECAAPISFILSFLFISSARPESALGKGIVDGRF
jgi:hypothetical protein